MAHQIRNRDSLRQPMLVDEASSPTELLLNCYRANMWSNFELIQGGAPGGLEPPTVGLKDRLSLVAEPP